MKKKKKNSDLNTYANAAMAAGLTYGQAQARDYMEEVKIGPIPKGYRKCGNKK